MSSSRQLQTTAVVTGASRGFGSAIAAALIDHGHRVVGVARTVDALAELGAAGVIAYAQPQGIDTNTFAAALQPLLTPAIVGVEIARQCQDSGDQDEHRVYELTGHGLHALA